MVNIIHILDYNNNVIRLIKKYHITLLDLFPEVLELIIREYVDDIINVEITKYRHGYIYDINCIDQYINYIPISFSFQLWISVSDLKIKVYNCKYGLISNNIVNN